MYAINTKLRVSLRNRKCAGENEGVYNNCLGSKYKVPRKYISRFIPSIALFQQNARETRNENHKRVSTEIILWHPLFCFYAILLK